MFSGNPDVFFGDVNLSDDDSPRGPPHNPGAGGWPTIRYFNQETGVDGGNYVKKTDKSMCDELGDEAMMRAYVEEYGRTSLCRVENLEGCDDRETAYVEKMREKSSEERLAQLKRLEAMEGGRMKPELKTWMRRRVKILEQFAEMQDEL